MNRFAAAGADLARAPRASVILPHLNTPDLLHEALSSLAAQELDFGWFEVIVVDNGSTVPMAAVREAWPEVRFLATSEPGPGPARNLGVAAARSDRLAFIDADVTVHPRWLEAGLAMLRQDPSRPIGGTVRIRTRASGQLSGVEAFECVFSFQQRRYIEREGYSVTANLMMDRRVFDRAGPFGGIDTPEDMDFGKRASALGHPPRFVAPMLAFHPARPSVAAIRAKNARVAHQKLSRFLASGKSLARFRIVAFLTMLSAPAMLPALLTSDRVRGLGQRLQGAPVLFAVRWYKGLDMLRLASAHASGRLGEAMSWNR